MSTYDTRVTLNTIKNDIKNSDSAIIEAVANAIDAKCKNIYIYVYQEENSPNVLGDIVKYYCLDIADDGDGLPIDQQKFQEAFCQYKVSPKKEKTNYGKKGKGRYTYLTLVSNLQNLAIYNNQKNNVYKISFLCDPISKSIQISNELFTDKFDFQISKPYTTLVRFRNIERDKFLLTEENTNSYIEAIQNELISFFADRIASKSINIYINDKLLIIDDYLVQPITNKQINFLSDDLECSFKASFYIWNEKIQLKADRQKHILFFDQFNILKGIAPSGKNKLAFSGFKQNHTIIVKSSYFDDIDYINDSDEFNNIFVDNIVKKLRHEITYELEKILFLIYEKNLSKVSKEYLKFLSISQDEMTEHVYSALMLPFVEKFGTKQISEDIKSIIAKFINTLIQEAPDSYLSNIKNILNLTLADSKKLQYVEANYGVIKTISEKEKYLERLDFLKQFDDLVNGKHRKRVKERSTLHHIVDKHLWLFGSQFEGFGYEDIASDSSLKTILSNEKFYQFDSDELKGVLSDENLNLKKIPDIYIPVVNDNTIYIIELKKPTVEITQKIMLEVMDKYAQALKKINENYVNKQQPKIIYGYAISDTKNASVYTLGDITQNGICIQAKTWKELIDDASARYNKKINELNVKIKQSKWQSLEEFVLDVKK